MPDETPPPFEVLRPPGRPTLLFDSPHSGRWYPPDWATKASHEELRRGEDAYVDQLIDAATASGAIVLLANYPRCYIDLNRAPDDIDVELLAGRWTGKLAPTDKSKKGLGLIRKYVVPGVTVNAAPIPVAEVKSRIKRIHQPYLKALDELVAELRGARSTAVHINWHSMKSSGNAMTPDGAKQREFDFVVSDLEGESAAPEYTTMVTDTLRALGYVVSLNDPYKGGSIVQRVGRPAKGVHSIQVEVNRALYLDESTVEKTGGFASLRANLLVLARTLAAAVQAATR